MGQVASSSSTISNLNLKVERLKLWQKKFKTFQCRFPNAWLRVGNQIIRRFYTWVKKIKNLGSSSSSYGPTFFQVVEEMFQSCEGEELTLFVGLVRKVWFSRNDVFTHPNEMVQQAMGRRPWLISLQQMHKP